MYFKLYWNFPVGCLNCEVQLLQLEMTYLMKFLKEGSCSYQQKHCAKFVHTIVPKGRDGKNLDLGI